ncbi:MAG: glycosyltransferase family 2 protein, partial [Candidatus Stahlbacteria bacterium]|nr:glycosyltransferase family 2 protein [Candidatus Stahlbacteria bacterium]
ETYKILSTISGIKLLRHSNNMGKGAAIRTALKHASGEVIIIQDADLEYSPNDYSKLLTPIEKGHAKVVYGSRFKGAGKFTPLSLIANRVLTWLTNFLYSAKLTDMETCYKSIKRDIINSLDLKSNRFEIEPELTAKLLLKGYKILEVPISYYSRTRFKKIGPRDGIHAIFTLIQWHWLAK